MVDLRPCRLQTGCWSLIGADHLGRGWYRTHRWDHHAIAGDQSGDRRVMVIACICLTRP